MKALLTGFVIWLAVICPAGMRLHAQIFNQTGQQQTPVNQDSLDEVQRRDSLVFAGSGSDTTHRKKRFYTRKVTYTIGTDNITTYPIDTGLDGRQNYDPAQKADFGYRTTGNLGSAEIPLIFNPSNQAGFDLGYHQFDIYSFSRENMLFYDSKIPYTHLFFLFGMRKEQMVSVTHNQNVGQYFNFGIFFNRYASKGGYEGQETNHNCFALTTRFRSKSDQYKLTGIFYFNGFQEQENGGVQGDTDIFYRHTAVPSLTSVEMTTAQDKFRGMSFYLRQEWRQGKRVERKVNDSTSISYLYPNLTFYHELGIGSQRNQYFDVAPISDYYGLFKVNNDSLLSNVHYSNWSNTLGFTLGKIIGVDSSGAYYRNFLIDASLYQSVGTVFQDPVRNEIQELRFNLQLRNHPDARSGLLYRATASYNLGGYNNQDLKVDGNLGYSMKKLGQLLAFGGFSRLEVPWLYNHFYFPGLQQDNGFRKTISFNVGLQYQIPKFHLRVSGQFYNITYPVFFDSNRLPQQASGSVQAWVVKLEKNFRWRHFGSDNLFVLQFFTGQDIYRFPKYWGRNSLFYENSIFKGNLMLRVGADIYYNTDYKGYGFFGFTGQYHLQDQLTLSYYPVLDIFLSMKIAEVVLFVKVENIDEGLFPHKNYYYAYKYPAPDRSFKVGLSWRFYQ